MEPTKFPKRPTVRWDPYKRQVLCCLYRFFTCNKKQTAEIFSYMFRSHLKQRGIQGFVPFATLNTQWIWMRNKRDPVWLRVHINTAFETSGEWGEIITKIKSAAKTLRFELHEKMEDDTHPSRCGPLVPDAEQNIASHGPAVPMLSQSLFTAETLNPIPLLSPSQDQAFEGRYRANQSADQSIDQSIGPQNDLHIDIPNRPHRSTEPVVTSNGKLCLWCEHEGTIHESEDIQELQNEDYDYDSEYEEHSDGNQHNDRQDDPGMTDYIQGCKQFVRELRGEELFDSESEPYLLKPHKSLSRMHSFCDPHLPLPLNLEQGSLDSEDNSDWCADRGIPANLADFGSLSIAMKNRSGALGNERTSTQESPRSFSFSHTCTDHDEALGDRLGGQNALQYEWLSNDRMRMETLRQMSVEALRQVEDQSTTHLSQEEIDVLMYDGNTWKQL
ncbi:hypothetical protein CBS147309_4818 [Penicillium roqueforti]|nr:hypothetical protein CBS147309_4818 [Penicillium roqueforti]